MLHRPLARIVVAAVGVPPLLLLHLRVDVDVLGLLEGFQAFAAELAADAAAPLAAEGGRVVVGEGVVDPDGTGPELPHALEHLLEVLRVHVGAEPERDGVGLLYRFIQAPDLYDRHHRPEGLIPHHRHGRRYASEDGGFVEEAPLPVALAPGDERGAFVDRLPDVAFDLIAARAIDHGPYVRRLVHRVPDVQRLDELPGCLDEVVRYFLLDVESFRGGTDLTGVQARGPHGALGRDLHVYIVADDEGVFPAELQVRGDETLGGGQADLASRLLAPGKRYHVHSQVLDEHRTDLTGPVQGLQQPGGQLLHELNEAPRS